MADTSGAHFVLHEVSGGDTITVAEVQLDFDTTDYSDSAVFTLTGSPVTSVTVLETGHYLFGFSLGTSRQSGLVGSTCQVRAYLKVNGSEIAYAQCAGHMEHTAGASETYPAATAVLSLAANDVVTFWAKRDDTGGLTPQRATTSGNAGGLWGVKLPDDSFCRVTRTNSPGNSTAYQGWNVVDWDTVDEEDSGFLVDIDCASGRVRLEEAGTYLVSANVALRGPNTPLSGSVQHNVIMRLVTVDSDCNLTEPPGARVSREITYQSAMQESVLSITYLLKTSAADQDLSLQAMTEEDSSGHSQIWNTGTGMTAMTIWKIPREADALRVYEAGGGQGCDTSGTATALDTDTATEEDTSTFDWTSGGTGNTVTVKQTALVLSAGCALFDRSSDPGANLKIFDRLAWRKNGTVFSWGSGQAQSLGPSGANNNAGGGSACAIERYVDTDTVDLSYVNTATDTDANATWQANLVGVQHLNLSQACARKIVSPSETVSISEGHVAVFSALLQGETVSISEGFVAVMPTLEVGETVTIEDDFVRHVPCPEDTDVTLVVDETVSVSEGHLFVMPVLELGETVSISDGSLLVTSVMESAETVNVQDGELLVSSSLLVDETVEVREGFFLSGSGVGAIVDETVTISEGQILILGEILTSGETVTVSDAHSFGEGVIPMVVGASKNVTVQGGPSAGVTAQGGAEKGVTA